jgi:hypothetical protein
VSKIKSAQEKKRLSLQKDRRNVYGECPTSSRKNIRSGKQRSHMEQRRAVSEELRGLKGTTEHLNADEIEFRVKTRSIDLQHHSFKKTPDAPLGLVIKRKQVRRTRRTSQKF